MNGMEVDERNGGKGSEWRKMNGMEKRKRMKEN